MADSGTSIANDAYEQGAGGSYGTLQSPEMPQQPAMNQGFQTLTTEPMMQNPRSLADKLGLGSLLRMSEWDQHSSSAYLFADTMANVAQQVVVLLLIILEVFRSKKHMAPCTPYSMADLLGTDPQAKASFAAACGCEFTKSCVRIFPIMAAMIALVVAKRVVLSKRAFYLLLKKGKGLLHFQKPDFQKDRLFWILTFMLFMAGCHFSLNVAYKYHKLRTLGGADITVNEAGHGRANKDVSQVLANIGMPVNEGLREYLWDLMMDYLLPAAIFMTFLIGSYDLSAVIQPMTKYFETDPEGQKRKISMALMVHEDKCAAISYERLDAMQEMTQCCDADEQNDKLWMEVAQRAEALKDEDTPELDSGEMFAKMWPARLLLDPRTKDKESSMFFRMWFYFNLGCDCLTAACILYYTKQMHKDLLDVFVKKEFDDAAGFMAQAIALTIIIGFLWDSMRATNWHMWPHAEEIREQLQNAKPVEEQRHNPKAFVDEAGDVGGSV